MKKNSQIIDTWNKHYSSDQENLYRNFFIRTLFDLGHRYIAKHGKDIQGTVLDIGSGMGYHLKFEKTSEERKYICLDKDPNMLKKIKRTYVKTVVGTCSDIPLNSKSVDLVIASHILEHLPTLDADLNEIRRVMKNSGTLIVVLPCDPGLLWQALTYFTPSRWRLHRLGLDYDVVMKHEHVNTFTNCLSLLKKKFTVLDETYYPFFVQNHHLNVFCCLKLVQKTSS